jgi:putative transposase
LPEEKRQLLVIGAVLDHDVADVIHVVQLKTYKDWLRPLGRQERFRGSGRPRIAEMLRRWVVRIGTENIRWGYQRVVEELKKLGYRIDPSTIRTILRESGLPPAPHRGSHPSLMAWNTFIHRSIESVVA